jgi:hypothetical protein
VREGARFAGTPAVWPDSFYATNAIKVHMKEAQGKRADQITEEMFDEHLPTWHQELDMMAEHGVLPHVIAIFGKPFWSRACASLRLVQSERHPQHLRLLKFEPISGECFHFANLVRFAGSGGEQDALLVRVRHPAARTKMGSARWLLGHPELSAAADERPDEEEIAKHTEGAEFSYRGRE